MISAISSGAALFASIVFLLCGAIVTKSLIDSAKAVRILEIALQQQVNEKIRLENPPSEQEIDQVEEIVRDAA